MKTNQVLALFAALAAVPLGLSAAKSNTPDAPSRIEVIYDHPEKFTDFRDSYDQHGESDKGYMQNFKEYIERRGVPYLAEGQKLSITFTDIDMAGDFEPWRGHQFYDVRIVKDIYPPRIKLSFKLTDANGAVVKEGERDLRDLAFQMSASPIEQNEALRYENMLMDDWLRREFPKAKK